MEEEQEHSPTEEHDVNVDMDSSSNEEVHEDKEIHPWPYLASMFAFIQKEDNSYRMKCLLCAPQNKELLAFNNSPSNLKVHVKVCGMCCCVIQDKYFP